MHTQVHLNPTELGILSIPRERCWIFASPILRLLHYESLKANRFNTGYDSEFSDDEGSYSDDAKGENLKYEEEVQVITRGLSSSWCLTQSNDAFLKNEHMSSAASSGFLDQNGLPVDNSSKTEPSHIGEDSLDDLSSGDGNWQNESKVTEINTAEDQDENYFFHIAFTPIECTVICSSYIMNKLFKEPLKACESLGYDKVKLIEESFLSLHIDSDGSIDNSSQILKLTKPLSENNISLFFLSSHFSNIVLIPYQLKGKVISILAKHNFEFSDISNSYIVNKADSDEESDDGDEKTKDTDTENLASNAFQLFKQSNIHPRINNKANLLLTGARSGEVTNTILKTAKNIASGNIPEYFCITRTSINEVSLLLPKSSRERSLMGFNSKNLIGSIQDVIIPITVDLYKLPLDSTGIVAGLASKIINGVKSFQADIPFEMNYLSMAQSAIVMVPKENLALVSTILDNSDYRHVI